jgi:hypothetical protein
MSRGLRQLSDKGYTKNWNCLIPHMEDKGEVVLVLN